jgi:DNA polymerase-3 subunit epsilon
MTRGQGSLVIDESEPRDASGALEIVDLSRFELPLPAPSAEEIAAHRAVLADIDKASRGKLLWQADLA